MRSVSSVQSPRFSLNSLLMFLLLLCLAPAQVNAQAQPVGIAVGGDNLTRLLWNNPDGSISLWKLDGNGNYSSQNSYGPYPGWSAASISMGPDNFARVLCTHPADGQMSLWRVDSSLPDAFNPVNYGPTLATPPSAWAWAATTPRASSGTAPTT